MNRLFSIGFSLHPHLFYPVQSLKLLNTTSTPVLQSHSIGGKSLTASITQLSLTYNDLRISQPATFAIYSLSNRQDLLVLHYNFLHLSLQSSLPFNTATAPC